MKKIILTLAVSCFLFSYGFGQFAIEWQRTLGGASADQFSVIKLTTDGGFIAGGFSSSDNSGDKTENSLGSYDYWIVKFDALGNIQWQSTIGGGDEDWLWDINNTSDGGYILGGTSNSNISGDKTENTQGFEDYWIVKLDASGNIQWQNTIGGNSIDWLSSISQTYDGGYIIGGDSYSNASGDKTENNFGIINLWIVKLDSIGNIEWQNTIGGNDDDECRSLIQTPDGGFVVSGFSTSNISGDKTENTFGQEDYWIVKLDPSGNIQWQNNIGGNGRDFCLNIERTNDSGFILAGESDSGLNGDKTEPNFGDFDYWIIKLDSVGNILWQNTIGGNSFDGIQSIKEKIQGGFIVSGLSVSNVSGKKTVPNKGAADFWIIELDSVGIIKNQSVIGGIGDELRIANNLLQIKENKFFIGCSSYSNRSIDKSEDCRGSLDYWILKGSSDYNSITGKVFSDLNSNQIHDANEMPIINHMLTELNTSGLSFSGSNGNYYLSVFDTGNYIVSPASLNYYNSIPVNHTAYFSFINQTDSLNDFAFQPTGVFNDLCITITPMGNFRANMDANYMINYENAGTTTLNGTVIFFPDNDVTFVSSSPTATSVTTDSVAWNVGTLLPFQTGSILVTVHINAGTPTGTLINSSVVIEPVAGDANTACNYNAWEVFVTGSFDPNAILVDRDTVLTTELSLPPYLNYIIYFQNTGNDTAFNVRVLNNIPPMLDVNSFEFVASSHPVNIDYGSHARLFTFTFDNILLPDSNVNEPASHGFIRYRIKPKLTLVAGDLIKNNAAIYFDFNQPVMTDTAVTEIVVPTNLTPGPSPKERGVVLAPNPVINLLSVSLSPPPPKADRVGLVVYDLFGREVFKSQIVNPKSQIKIDVSGFSQGIYFVEVQSGEKILKGKFLKE